MAGLSGTSNSRVDSHIDVTEDDGLIIIPYKKIPDDWTQAPDINSYRSLVRNFVFPGEEIQLLVCLSANKHNTGINSVSQAEDANGKIDSQKDVSTSESFLRMEDRRRQTDELLQRFKNSHFFARIAESNEPLWYKRSAREAVGTQEEKLSGDSLENVTTLNKKNPISVMIDRGKFDSPSSGGVSRGAAKCCSLSNGDVVVLLQVKVGVEFMRDPILEILQFEKHHERNPILENHQHIITSFNHDPFGELLNWLLPLNNSRRPYTRAASPILNSSSNIWSTSTKCTLSSGSELLPFGHVRSYSTSSIQQYSRPTQAVTTPNATPSFVEEDQNQFSFKNFAEIGKSSNEGMLSFRGVSLVPERFLVQCGLEGIFTPGRRWRRKFELIQPLEISTFSVDCNTDDLLCVNVKNASPANAPDVVVFIDSVTIVFEEASKSGLPLSLPIACAEAGNDYSLPNLALRRGEEHSFILKPATTLWKHSKGHTSSNFPPQCSTARTATSNQHPTIQYAVLISCRCNYTESKLFFKHPISWQPRVARDLMISVASEITRQTLASDGTKLPVQVLTLQASNMTSDDLSLTVLATESCTSPSLQIVENGPQSASIDDQPMPLSDAFANTDPSCTHLWLQSRVPLGCVPSRTTATVKLELIPLMDGIITLDSLQIDAKEKGLTYMPKHSMKINATRELPLI